MYQLKWFPVERHVMIRNNANPDDPTLSLYWKELAMIRADYKKFSLLRRRDDLLAQKQEHICPICSGSLYNGEVIHRHHIIEGSRGGKDTPSNWILLHLPCHYQVHHSRGEMKTILNERLISAKKNKPVNPI